jgi:CRP-like cAMP-binding protein
MEDLSRFALFAAADPEALSRRARAVRWRSCVDGEPILDHGDQSDDVVLVGSGRVRIVVISEGGRRMTLTELSEGEIFGELAAIDRGPRSASVFAAGPVRVGVLPGEAFREIATSTPEAALALMCVLTARIRAMNERQAEQTFLTAGQRLCAMLMRISRPRAANPTQRIISPPPTHESLAEMLGCRREVVSRELSSLAKAGVVERARGGLVLAAPQALSTRVAEALAGKS